MGFFLPWILWASLFTDGQIVVSFSTGESSLSLLNAGTENSSTNATFMRLIFFLCLRSSWVVVASLWCCFAHSLPWSYIYLPLSIDHIFTKADSCSLRQNKFVPSNETADLHDPGRNWDSWLNVSSVYNFCLIVSSSDRFMKFFFKLKNFF